MNKLKGLRIAILVADGFEQIEMVDPRNALNNQGAETILVSPNDRQVQGWNHADKGDVFPVDVTLDKANANDYDALVLPGGVMNPDELRLIPKAIAFIKHFVKEKKPIAAICHGSWTLIDAEGVKGKTMTSWPSIKIDLTNAGATWVDKPVVKSDNLITSRNPHDLPQFNQAIIELLTTGKN